MTITHARTAHRPWRLGSRLREIGLTLAAGACALVAAPHAGAQVVPKVPSPLAIQADSRGVNLATGKRQISLPVLQVPAAPRLRFERVQNAAPYVVGQRGAGDEDTTETFYSGQLATLTSESFKCLSGACQNVSQSGSTFQIGTRRLRVAGSGELYEYGSTSLSMSTTGGYTLIAYVTSVTYPDGEQITYTYDTTPYPGWSTFIMHRPTRIASSVGYHIDLTYQGNTALTSAWGTVATAAIYRTVAPTVPLMSLTYGSGGTITDQAGRVWTCGDCRNTLDAEIEGKAGTLTLPGMTAPSTSVAGHGSADVVASVTEDGLATNYSYTNLRLHQGRWLYSHAQVADASGTLATYTMEEVGLADGRESTQRVSAVADALGRTTGYGYDIWGRVVRQTLPEGDRVRLVYDDHGNVVSRTTDAKPGSGLASLVEQATFDPACGGVLCWRPTTWQDARGNTISYSYDANGQVVAQLDPADATGQRRKLKITYDALSRPIREEVCAANGAGAELTCGTAAASAKLTTYWNDTRLPASEALADGTGAGALTTTYSYTARHWLNWPQPPTGCRTRSAPP